MMGSILNSAGILAGGAIGLAWRKQPSAANQQLFKIVLGAFTVLAGLRLTWDSLNGSLWQVLRQVLVLLLALILGRMIGRLLRLQHFSNSLGQYARDQIARAGSTRGRSTAGIGFKTCAALYCAAPLGLLGAIQDGLSGYFYPLAIKGVIEGLATLGFISIFGWGVLLSALPVLVLQGTISLLCSRFLLPVLSAHSLVDPINAVGGMLVFTVALVIFDLKKLEVTNYLPSLAVAPLLTLLF